MTNIEIMATEITEYIRKVKGLNVSWDFLAGGVSEDVYLILRKYLKEVEDNNG